jgi:Na+/phosphate symporter
MTMLTSIPVSINFGLVFGGFALFIYGVTTMGDGFKNLAGSKVRLYIEKYTGTTLMAIIMGALISGLLHSSTAVTVISISLVRAKLMKLEQAIGITIGANIGTTFTSILIGLNIEAYAYYIIFAGVVLFILAKKEVLVTWGKILLGFGLIFVGLELMGDQLQLIAKLDGFETMMVWMGNNPWLALGGGTIVTAVAQSSTVVIGIVQKLYAVDGISATAAVAFIYGANIGTCLTAILASVGGGVETKRAAWFHAVYNILGALIGMVLLTPFMALVDWSITAIHGSPELYIANAHFLFNMISTVLVFPFVKQCVKLLQVLIPGEDEDIVQTVPDLDEHFITELPEQAIAIVKNAIVKMNDVSKTILHCTEQYLNTKNIELKEEIINYELIINEYDTKISAYLVKMAQRASHSATLTDSYYSYLQIVKHLERIGDVSTNLFEFYEVAYLENESFSQEAHNDLENMYTHIYDMIDRAIDIFNEKDDEKVEILIEKEDELDILEARARETHFDRMRDGTCTTNVASSVYVDILSNLERIGDHAISIAEVAVDPVEYHLWNKKQGSN